MAGRGSSSRRSSGSAATPTPQAASPAANVAVISCGVNSETLPVAGKTVAEVRAQYAQAFNISPDAKAYFDGEEVTDEAQTTVDAGSTLEFGQHAGEKGN